MLAFSLAEYRYAPAIWSVPSIHFSDIEEFDKINNDNSNSNHIHESDLLDKFLPITYKPRKALRKISRLIDEERKKKFSSESANLQDTHSLQGLWAMPGRR